MKEYRVYVETIGVFIAEVKANSEKEAEELATDIWNETHFRNLSGVEMGNVFTLPSKD